MTNELIKPLEAAAQGAGYRNYRDATENVSGQAPVLNSILAHAGTLADLTEAADEIERLREALLVAELVMRAAFADPESLIYSELSTNCFASAMEIVTAALKGQDHAKLHTDGG